MKIKALILALAILMASCKADNTNSKVEIVTTHGTIIVKLYDQTPLHRDNFLKLVEGNNYDSVLFHRVIDRFMIQSGDPDSKRAAAGAELGESSIGHDVNAEFVPSLFHKKGALAAAREGDDVNPERRSSGSQFYIVQGIVYSPEELEARVERINSNRKEDEKLTLSPEQTEAYTTIGGTPHLDGQYTVFGEVVDGLDVVDKIASVQTDANDRPLEDVRIIRMVRIK